MDKPQTVSFKVGYINWMCKLSCSI